LAVTILLGLAGFSLSRLSTARGNLLRDATRYLCPAALRSPRV